MYSKDRFGGLDLLRFLAASLVMLFHFTVVSWHLPISPNYEVTGAPDYRELSGIDIGWIGVEIFFVLSGFVIAQSADGRSAFQFLRGRAGRLLPTVWICATITLGAVVFFKMKLLGPVFSSYLKTIVLYPNGPWISNIYWTLIVEIAFYTIILVTLLANVFRYIEALAIGLVVFSAIYLTGLAFFDWARIQPYYLAQHGCFFGLGILIWLIHVRGSSFVRIFFLIFALLACLLEICVIGNGQLSGYQLWLAPLVWLAAIVVIHVSIARPGSGGGEVTRTLGLVTFPLYLVHEKLGAGILRVAPISGRWMALALAVAVVLSVSFMVLKVEPLIRYWLELALDWFARNCIPKLVLMYLNKKTVSVADWSDDLLIAKNGKQIT